jgi:hypothetical protein
MGKAPFPQTQHAIIPEAGHRAWSCEQIRPSRENRKLMIYVTCLEHFTFTKTHYSHLGQRSEQAGTLLTHKPWHDVPCT